MQIGTLVPIHPVPLPGYVFVACEAGVCEIGAEATGGRDTLAERADVVIIGAGVVGSSIACHLVQVGVRSVVMLESAERQGSGTTGRAIGGVRAQFANPAHIRMSLHSLDCFARFEEITGIPSGYRPNGYLLLATRPGQLERLHQVREHQRAAGLHDVEILSAAEIAYRFPLLRVDAVFGGAFRQADGFIDPLALVQGYTQSAVEGGARLRLAAPAIGIRVRSGRVAGVQTPDGFISTRTVVNAAGPWAAAIARMADIDLPVRPLRRQIVGIRPLAGLPPDLPMVIDLGDGLHFRPDFRVGPPPGLRIGAPDPVEVWDFGTEFDPSILAAIFPRAELTAPLLRGAVVDRDRCSAGLYEVSPDHHAILGSMPEVEGFFFANGFSGHGVMHSPATGLILAELITRGVSSTFPEVAEFAPDRFREGRLLHEPAVY